MNTDPAKKTITEDDVKYVAGLARLRLDDAQTVKFKDQLSAILDYINQLNRVNTENVAPTTHVLTSMKNVFRKDVLKASLSPEEALKNAPDKNKNFFKVPKVIKDV